jgi:ERF superfamily
MNQSGTIAKFAKALSLFQGEVEDLTKNKKGFGYKYGDLSQALKIARPLLSKNGLSVIQSPGRFVEDRIEVETRILHESGEWVSSIMEIPVTIGKGMIAAQASGSAISYGRRQAFLANLGMAAEDDDLSSIAANPDSVQQPMVQLQPLATKITEKQIAEIKNFLNNDESRYDKMCKHYKVNVISELNYNTANIIIESLKKIKTNF